VRRINVTRVPLQSIIVGVSVEAVGGQTLLLFSVEELCGLNLRKEKGGTVSEKRRGGRFQKREGGDGFRKGSFRQGMGEERVWCEGDKQAASGCIARQVQHLHDVALEVDKRAVE
jgi:hypothetical protein